MALAYQENDRFSMRHEVSLTYSICFLPSHGGILHAKQNVLRDNYSITSCTNQYLYKHRR